MTNPHGYLMLFPHYLREGVTVEPLIFSLPPAGGPPAVAAMNGRDEIGRPWLGITYDASPNPSISKAWNASTSHDSPLITASRLELSCSN